MAQYAEIVEIVAPAQAAPGALVNVTVKIQNLYSAPMSIGVTGVLDYGVTPWPDIQFPEDWATVDGGDVAEFSGYFYMPDKSVTIHAYSFWYGDDGTWHFDDEKTKNVAAAVLTPQISEFKIADFARV